MFHSKKGAKMAKGRKSQFEGKKLRRLVKENPFRKGSQAQESWKCLKSGMSYREYMNKGGRTYDLRIGVLRGYIGVE